MTKAPNYYQPTRADIAVVHGEQKITTVTESSMRANALLDAATPPEFVGQFSAVVTTERDVIAHNASDPRSSSSAFRWSPARRPFLSPSRYRGEGGRRPPSPACPHTRRDHRPAGRGLAQLQPGSPDGRHHSIGQTPISLVLPRRHQEHPVCLGTMHPRIDDGAHRPVSP